jgi:hypothetical protein
MAKKNMGLSFDDFLKEEAMLEDVTAVAMKRVISWQIAQEMKAQQLTKATSSCDRKISPLNVVLTVI